MDNNTLPKDTLITFTYNGKPRVVRFKGFEQGKLGVNLMGVEQLSDGRLSVGVKKFALSKIHECKRATLTDRFAVLAAHVKNSVTL